MEKYQLKRTNRKSCVLSRGIYEFGFDLDKEFCKWQFVSGVKMGKKEWETAQELQLEELTSSRVWREDIIQKYNKCNNIQLEEFKSYLKIVRASIIADNKFINKIYSHIISSLVTILITQLVTNTVGKSDSALLVQFIVWAVYIICFGFILIPVVFILIDYFRNIRNSDFKLFFVDSYIEVIEDMCCIQQERDIK